MPGDRTRLYYQLSCMIVYCLIVTVQVVKPCSVVNWSWMLRMLKMASAPASVSSKELVFGSPLFEKKLLYWECSEERGSWNQFSPSSMRLHWKFNKIQGLLLKLVWRLWHIYKMDYLNFIAEVLKPVKLVVSKVGENWLCDFLVFLWFPV